MKKEKKLVIILIIILILIDQIFKISLFLTNGQIEIGTFLTMGIYNNEISEDNLSYILIEIIIIIALIRSLNHENQFIKIDTRIMIAFALAGATSNLVDRIWQHKVINYINIGKFLSLNLAYIYIIIAWVGIAIILTKYTSSVAKERKKEKAKNQNYNKEKSNNINQNYNISKTKKEQNGKNNNRKKRK